MSDNLRQYRAIHDALQQWYPDRGNSHIAQHLTTLAALISGIVASRSSQLPAIATNVPDGDKPESRVKRYTRWVRNGAIGDALYFFPYAKMLLACLALETLVLVIDGSTVGRGCVALMVHVVYKGRALPIGWLVRQGKKGHCSEALHLALVEQVKPCSLWVRRWCFLAMASLIARSCKRPWMSWAGRMCAARPKTPRHSSKAIAFASTSWGPASNPAPWWRSKTFGDGRSLWPRDDDLLLGQRMQRPHLPGEQPGIGLPGVSEYEKRFRIETFFSDQKSRGSFPQVSPCQSRAAVAFIDCVLSRLYLDRLCGDAV